MNVAVIPMLSDNFCYYAYRKDDITKGFFVDVSQPEKLEGFMKACGIEKPTHVLSTHKHHDHSGGNVALAQSYPYLKVIGGAHDSIPGCNHPINDGDILDIYGIKIKCLHTPCHTKGHILYYCESDHGEEEKKDFERVMNNGY